MDLEPFKIWGLYFDTWLLCYLKGHTPLMQLWEYSLLQLINCASVENTISHFGEAYE